MSVQPHHTFHQASTKSAPHFHDQAQRSRSATAFEQGAATYNRIRPGYPTAITSLLDGARRVVDIGCGTGKLTKALVQPGRTVFGIDPSIDMLRCLAHEAPIPLWQATAERTGLADASVDAVTLAQTWHWVEPRTVCQECDRILLPSGRILLVWNTLDVTVPWVLRYARISHSGDIHREGFLPTIFAPWTIAQTQRIRWRQQLTPEELIMLAHTRSYWLRSTLAVRDRVDANLQWYLYEHLRFRPQQSVMLPYRTDAFVLERSIEPKN